MGTHFEVSTIYKIGHEWGRGGSPRADTRAQRSHGLQEGFWIPPGPPGYHTKLKKASKVQKSKKNANIQYFPVYLTPDIPPWRLICYIGEYPSAIGVQATL